MVDVLKETKESIQSLWTGRCNIYNFQKVKKKGITSNEEVLLYENERCRLSHKTISQNSQTSIFATTTQVIKLFIDNELVIPSGCAFEITQNGITKKYKHSGVSAVYTNHQEIVLELEQEKA